MSCACSRLFSTGSLQGHTGVLFAEQTRSNAVPYGSVLLGAIRCARNRLSTWRQPGIVGHVPADTQNRDGAKLVVEAIHQLLRNPEISKLSLLRLAAGGRWIRTLGPFYGIQRFCGSWSPRLQPICTPIPLPLHPCFNGILQSELVHAEVAC